MLVSHGLKLVVEPTERLDKSRGELDAGLGGKEVDGIGGGPKKSAITNCLSE